MKNILFSSLSTPKSTATNYYDLFLLFNKAYVFSKNELLETILLVDPFDPNGLYTYSTQYCLPSW